MASNAFATLPQRPSVDTTAWSLPLVVVGNQGGYGYRLASWLRKIGVETDLILFEGFDNHERDLPENVDRSLSGDRYPAWIKSYTTWDKRFGELDQRYGVALSLGPSGLAAITSMPQALPVVHFTMGTEVSQKPIQFCPATSLLGSVWEKLSYHRLFASTSKRVRRMQTLHARKSLRRANAVISIFTPEILAAQQIGMLDKLRLWPFPEDVAGNHARVDDTRLRELNQRYVHYDCVFLWLSRLNFASSGAAQKGPECFLRAFAGLVNSSDKRIRAVVGSHGHDVDRFRQLASKLGVDSHIEYITHLPFWELVTYLSITNAVLCDGITPLRNTASGIVREAISVGAPVITHIDQALMQICYGSALPVEFAADEGSCFTRMREVAQWDTERRARARQATRQWAESFLDYHMVLPGLLRILSEAHYLHLHVQNAADNGGSV